MTESSCSDSSSETKPNEKTQVIYRCKKCRQIVASQESIVSHEQGKGEASFGSRKRRAVSEALPECTAIFVEPLKWMQTGERHSHIDAYICHLYSFCLDIETI